jgi:hypothetical protein
VPEIPILGSRWIGFVGKILTGFTMGFTIKNHGFLYGFNMDNNGIIMG